jgi:penicillin-binding protein 2
MHKRISVAFFSLIFIFGLLVSNMGIIMLKTGISPSSQSTSKKSIVLSNSRGMIYDTHMKKLVNTEAKNITVCLPTQKALNDLKSSLNENQLNELYDNIKIGKISIFETPDTFHNSYVKSVTSVERYSDNQPCVHLIGHLDENNQGVMGLEKAYNSYLLRYSGELKAIWNSDAIGNILLGEGIKFESNNYLSPAGIQLTIDFDIQKIAENALIDNNIEKGAIVILNSFTNEILAMASLPIFNPNDLSADIENKNSPFINRAITPYSIGSVFKPIVSACALENNIQLTYNCNGSIEINGTTFKCSNDIAHGTVDMCSAMEESCNCYFIALGQKLNVEKFLNLCNDFGFGKSIELADNFTLKSGNLPSFDSISSPQSLANISFGQGDLLASPLHLAVAYSCFANGGYYRPPTLMKGIIDENGKIIQKVKIPDSYQILNKSTVNKTDEILMNVVVNGNGKKAYSGNTVNHGKTATAQSGWYENGSEVNHTWFCGYFTANDTTYTVVIFKDDGKSGSTDCAPAFKDISEEISSINK